MSAILKVCQKMYTNDVSLPMLKSCEVRTHIQLIISTLFPENLQPKIASLYLDSLGLILIF